MIAIGDTREWRAEIERPAYQVPARDPKEKLREAATMSVLMLFAVVVSWQQNGHPLSVFLFFFGVAFFNLISELVSRYRNSGGKTPEHSLNYEQVLTLNERQLRSENRDKGKTLWSSRSKLHLKDLWGVKDMGDRIRVISKPMYQTAFEFHSAVFPTEAEKREFFAFIESIGCTVIPDRSKTA